MICTTAFLLGCIYSPVSHLYPYAPIYLLRPHPLILFHPTALPCIAQMANRITLRSFIVLPLDM
jgi:hypothetical protein